MEPSTLHPVVQKQIDERKEAVAAMKAKADALAGFSTMFGGDAAADFEDHDIRELDTLMRGFLRNAAARRRTRQAIASGTGVPQARPWAQQTSRF